MGSASSFNLGNSNDRISFPSTRIQSKKLSKLLPCPGVHSRWQYRAEGEQVIWHRTVPQAVTELRERKSFVYLSKAVMVFSSFKVEEGEAAVRALLETTWMDWWAYAGKSLTPCDRYDTVQVKFLFIASARCQHLVFKTASTIWVNALLKQHDAVLVKVKDNISF